MNTLIGKILLEMRKKRQITEKQLSEGICTVSAYSNYERRDRIPDFLTLNYLLERLGHGITGLTAYLSEEEINYIRWRNWHNIDVLKWICFVSNYFRIIVWDIEWNGISYEWCYSTN